MNTNLKSKDTLHLLQLANKLENSITYDNESLDQKCHSLVHDVLYELNISSQILDGNIRETEYMDIQKDNIFEYSYFMTNGCN